MKILEGTGVDQGGRRLNAKVYTDQSFKVRMDPGETKNQKNGRRVIQECCIVFNLYSENPISEDLGEFPDFKIEVQVIPTVKYADELMLLGKEETVLQSMTDRLIEIGR